MKKKSYKLNKLERNRFSLFSDNENECYFCHRETKLTWHEIYSGKNRQNSMRYGLCLRICLSCYNRLELDNKKQADYDGDTRSALPPYSQPVSINDNTTNLSKSKATLPTNSNMQNRIINTIDEVKNNERVNLPAIDESNEVLRATPEMVDRGETTTPILPVINRNQFNDGNSKFAKVKSIRLYDLRHTYVATMMAEGQQLYYISSKLGHSNYNTTMNKYGHLSDETRKEIEINTDKYY